MSGTSSPNSPRSTSRSPGPGGVSSLHLGQISRTSRCATTSSIDEATRYGSMPISMRRGAAPRGALGCRGAENKGPPSAARVEDAEHDRLAVDHRDHRYAQVDLAPANLEPDAPVLREALLGDVEVAEDLDARDDGGVELADLARDVGLVEHAVDAVAHAELVVKRIDVNVAGAQLQGFGEDLVDELDDRCVL